MDLACIVFNQCCGVRSPPSSLTSTLLIVFLPNLLKNCIVSGANPSISYLILDGQLRKLRDTLCIRVLYVGLAHRMIGFIRIVPFFFTLDTSRVVLFGG